MERGKRLENSPIDESCNIEFNEEEFIKQHIKLWTQAGYTTEQAEQIVIDSMINNFDVGITAEDASIFISDIIKNIKL